LDLILGDILLSDAATWLAVSMPRTALRQAGDVTLVTVHGSLLEADATNREGRLYIKL
jgi:hypothetical protein